MNIPFAGVANESSAVFTNTYFFNFLYT